PDRDRPGARAALLRHLPELGDERQLLRPGLPGDGPAALRHRREALGHRRRGDCLAAAAAERAGHARARGPRRARRPPRRDHRRPRVRREATVSAPAVASAMDETTVPVAKAPPGAGQKEWLDRALAQVDDGALLRLAMRMIEIPSPTGGEAPLAR